MRLAMILASILLLVVPVVGIACGSGDDANTEGSGNDNLVEGLVSPTWIDAQVEGDTVSIATSELTSGKQLHFKISTDEGDRTYMAYQLGGETHVRANVCPPCKSIRFSREGDELICDNCSTVFNALTGDGISGACRNFPKARVNTETNGDSTTMSLSDLSHAYDDTQKAGWP
ncbi:MAG: Fe-S-containing protein [Chloroflexota bacterium]|nr:Fe-S-containing protein [Chloroflexota bacterium]